MKGLRLSLAFFAALGWGLCVFAQDDGGTGPPASPTLEAPAAPSAPAAPPPGAPDAPFAPAPREKPVLPRATKPYVITIHHTVDAGLLYSLKRRCRQAVEAGADLIVFDVDTYGGLLDEALQMADYVASLDGPPTVAYISRKALSAGALFSVACDHIVMRRNTTLGDCAPIIMTQEGPQIVGEKQQSPLRAAFATYAKAQGISAVLAQAMVTMEWEVVRYSRLDDPKDWGDQDFVRKEEFERLPKSQEEWEKNPIGTTWVRKHEIACAAGELLTLDDERAVAYEFARARVRDRAEALDLFGTTEAQAVVLDTSWSEEMVRWLNGPAVAGLLLLVGLIAAYIALNTPGMGVPEIVAVACFAILFGSRFLVGLAGTFDIALVVIGIALLLVEILLIPGFGVTGIAGIICVLAGFVLMSQSFRLPRVPGEVEFFVNNLLAVGGAFFLSLVGFFILLRVAPGVPVLRRLVLTAAQPVGGALPPAACASEDLVGRRGVALTHLRPAGRVELASEVFDVVTEGEYVEPGERVEVVAARGHRIVVRRA